MNYKAGAQAGASRCQRHHPARTFRLATIILTLMIHARQAIVNGAGEVGLTYLPRQKMMPPIQTLD
ncbi:hypothetical protein [Candidatus Binatus sp.]